MTNVRVKLLIWDSINRVHIKKHNVSVNEVEQTSSNKLAHLRGKKGRKRIYEKEKK